MKNKKLNFIFNILLGIAGVAFFICLILYADSVKYKNREKEDPAEAHGRVFEYELRHQAYNEIISHYSADRLSNFEPQPGFEDSYRVAQYAHAAFMSAIYEAEQNESKAKRNDTTRESLKQGLGRYSYTADQIDEIIRKALAK